MTLPFRVLAALLVVLAFAAPDARAQSGQSLFTTWCAGCHGPAGNNKDGVLGGKDWTIIKLAMDTRPDMTADLRPAYNQGLLTDAMFMSIANYLATFSGGATGQLGMPAPFAFGNQPVGVASTVQTKNVSSLGNAAVQILSVSNSNPAEFTVVGGTCVNNAFVNPLSSCSMSIQFTPLVAGARSGTITIVSNGVGSPQTIQMSGTGQSGTPSPGALSVPGSVTFGSSAIGVQTAASVVTVTNTGGSAVQVGIGATNPAAEFPITALTCGGSLAAGANCTVSVAFRPQAAGARSGTLTITNTTSGVEHVVTLAGTGTGGTPTGPNKVVAIEYFHAQIGHYFLTAQTDEQAGLDTGFFAGWARTGNSFNVWDGVTGGALPVFRLYTTKFANKAAHFYTTNTIERDGIRTENGGDWTYEKIAYYLPEAVGGTCPAGAVPIYRMFNNGQTQAPNHRFTTSLATYQEFTSIRGWAGEGVVFCAPQ